MAVIRVNKTADYTVMSNRHLKEREMSLKAKGLLSLMLSLHDDWNYSIAGLCAICVEKESAIKTTLDELKRFGYLKVSKLFPNETDSGRIEYIYDIYETPQKQGNKKPLIEKQQVEKQGIENLPLEKQEVENPLQLNTNKSITKKSITNISNTNNINIYNTEFETLWKMYPNKKGKPKALKAYQKARKNGVTFEEVKQGIENYNKQIAAKKTEIEFIKHGSTWFNNEGWTDEYDFTPKTEKPTGGNDNAGTKQGYWSDKFTKFEIK